ncbi:MAG: cobalamin-independent methionine synthase II family protein [Alphaproteobacteria bacterium]|nr:cobalamin-independent methionine synthase II family protein [Alphaproteobacteria bacterium]
MLTTTIGAYPKPDDVPIKDWFQKDGGTDDSEPTVGYAETLEHHRGEIDDILDRATAEVVREQVELGIDIPTDGEVRRENYIHYHCRHLKGVDFETLTEKQMRGHYMARLPTITGPISAGQAFLVRDWQVAQAATKHPVKMTVPGPMTIGDSIADPFYENDAVTRGGALADALNVEIRRLAEAGCPVIQVDEPVFARKCDQALAYGIEHLDRCFHKVPRTTERVVHICCGYPDKLDPDESYPKAPKEAYFDLATGLQDVAVDAVSIEDAHRPNDCSLLERFTRTKVILGVIAIAKSEIEEVEAVRARLQKACEHIDPHRLLAAPDCGLGFLGRDLTRRKLRVLAEAAHSL